LPAPAMRLPPRWPAGGALQARAMPAAPPAGPSPKTPRPPPSPWGVLPPPGRGPAGLQLTSRRGLRRRRPSCRTLCRLHARWGIWGGGTTKMGGGSRGRAAQRSRGAPSGQGARAPPRRWAFGHSGAAELAAGRAAAGGPSPPLTPRPCRRGRRPPGGSPRRPLAFRFADSRLENTALVRNTAKPAAKGRRSRVAEVWGM
jgi:hypothetical protein